MRRYVSVEVEVDLSEFDSEDLREELNARASKGAASATGGGGAIPPLNGEERHPLHEIYYALKFGMDDSALGFMRTYINDELGTAL